jgi:protein SCO1/2
MRIMRYIFGLYPAVSDIRLAIIESADGKIGKSPLINVALLACYKYDSTAGGYTLNIPLIFGGVGIFMLTFTLTIALFYSKKVKKRRLIHGLHNN